MRWMLTGLTAALVTVTLPAAPAAAAVDDHFHTAISTSTTAPERSATVACPAGQIVWGFGALTVGGAGHVALVALYPDATLTSATAIARVRDGWIGPWWVQVSATCWPAGNVGLQRVVGTGSLAAQAACPGQKKVYASGFEVSASAGEPYVSAVVPDNDMSGLTVRAGGSPSLFTRAVALCGLANTAQIYIYERTEETVAVDPGTSTIAVAPPMPHSPTGWSWVTGAGASSTRANMFIDALGPVAGLDQGTARMSRIATTSTTSLRATQTDDGEVTTYGTCIGAWY
jgi:hypothetical protein